MSRTAAPLTPEEERHFKIECPKCGSYRTGLHDSKAGRDKIRFRCEKCRHVWRVPWSELDRDKGNPASWNRPKVNRGGRKAPPAEEREETDMAKKKAAKKGRGAKAKKSAPKKAAESSSGVKLNDKGDAVFCGGFAGGDGFVPVGTVLTGDFKGKPFSVKVTSSGFALKGRTFKSLGIASKTICGYPHNELFLRSWRERKMAKKAAAKA